MYSSSETRLTLVGEDRIEKQECVNVIGAFSISEASQKLMFCSRPLGAVVSPNKTELELNVEGLSTISAFEVSVHDSMDGNTSAQAWCLPFNGGVRLCAEVRSKALFNELATGLQQNKHGLKAKVGFVLNGCWEDGGGQSLLFAEERYDLSGFDVLMAAHTGEIRADLANVLEELQAIRQNSVGESPLFASAPVEVIDYSEDVGEIKELLIDMKSELQSIEPGVSAINSNSGDIANIPDEIIRIGNALGGIKLLLVLNLVALIAIFFKLR